MNPQISEETSIDKDTILRNLAAVWQIFPDWRFGQLIFFLAADANESSADVFNLTDEALITSCESLKSNEEALNSNVIYLKDKCK